LLSLKLKVDVKHILFQQNKHVDGIIPQEAKSRS